MQSEILTHVQQTLYANNIYTISKLREILNDDEPNRKKYFFIVEHAACIKHNLLPWKLVPLETLKEHHLTSRRDMGIDGASLDMKTSMQAKWYSSKHTVTFTDIAKFHALSDIIQSKRRIVCVLGSHGVSKVGMQLPNLEIDMLTNDEIIKLLSPLLSDDGIVDYTKPVDSMNPLWCLMCCVPVLIYRLCFKSDKETDELEDVV